MFDRILDVFYPRSCEICGSNDVQEMHYLCWECRSQTMFIMPPYCSLCGDPVAGRIDHEYVCAACSSKQPSFDIARSAVHYEGPVASMLRRLKYNGCTWLATDLAKFLTESAATHYGGRKYDHITCVPLFHARRRERGFNQAALIARALSRTMNVPLACWMLSRTCATPSQTALNARQRAANVEKAFRARFSKWIENRTVLLIDDVMTTGATVNECAKTLKEAGAAVVDVLTVARG